MRRRRMRSFVAIALLRLSRSCSVQFYNGRARGERLRWRTLVVTTVRWRKRIHADVKIETRYVVLPLKCREALGESAAAMTR